MIATLAEVKSILGISVNTQDTQLAAIMPCVQRDILDYLNQDFRNTAYLSIGKTISFSTVTISDSGSGFTTAGFVPGNIVIEGSKYNDGYYTVTNVTAGALTISESLVTELAGSEVTITKCVYPPSLKIPFSFLSKAVIDSGLIPEFKSETLPDGYRIDFGIGGYPQHIVAMLDKYRKVRV